MKSNNFKILAIDPGETSGVCIFNTPNEYKTLSIKKSLVDVANIILDTKPDVLVFERFALYPTHAKSLVWDEMYTSQTIGVIKYICEINNIKYFTQSASDKEYVVYPKDYTFPNDHERDAYGHAWFFYMNKIR